MLAIADVAVVVSNAKAAAKWWKESVGFSTYTIPGSGHAVLVAPPGERLILHLCEGFEAVDPGNTGIGFVTDEIDRMVHRMTEAGVTFPEPLSREKWGGMAKFADPDGNVFWLLEAPTAMVRATLNSRGARGVSRRRSAKRKPRRSPRRK
ncbi:MAG: VOC family protein [Thermoplasmata archaeon]